jgi:HD-GYP domain-containing protein (c-di-GMP phosphodiesterase class II)
VRDALIGKLDVPALLLSKPGALDAAERTLIERHCVDGARRLLAPASPDSDESSTAAVAVALPHHEWWNGWGYPYRLKGAAIPRCARSVAVADVMDALMSVRACKPAWSLQAAPEDVSARRGTQFEPDCIDAMRIRARTLPTDWRVDAPGWRSATEA